MLVALHLTLVLFCIISSAHHFQHFPVAFGTTLALPLFVLRCFPAVNFAARVTDHQSATADDVRVTRTHVEELDRETGHLDARITALEENKGEC